MRLLWTYLERYGRPGAFYTDKDRMFTINRPGKETRGEDEAWEEAWTQIGRALRELGIDWIAAYSPQAKGRVERFFGTAQDRLVKGLRKVGVFLAAILSHVEERVVSHDYTIRYAGKSYQMAREAIRPGLRGGAVRVEQRLDGRLAVRFRDRYLAIRPCEPRPRRAEEVRPRPCPKPPPSRGQGAGSWMKDFDLREPLR